MARMRAEAREAATNRAAPMSPGALRRLRRRKLYHARRAALIGARNPVAVLNAPPPPPVEDVDAAAMNAGAPSAETANSLLQTVPVMGEGPPLGSQEPRQRAVTQDSRGRHCTHRHGTGRGRGRVANPAPVDGRGRGNARGIRLRRGAASGRSAAQVPSVPTVEEPPAHWTPPAIVPVVRSPILLRRHSKEARRVSEGTAADPIFVGEENASDREDHIIEDVGEKSCTDSDIDMLDEGGFRTPPPLQRMRHPSPALCRWTLADFTPGAPEPNPYLRQSVGEYLPWLHNCGEETCPFTEPSAALQRLSLETGMPLPDSDLSPGDHARVDKRAFTRDTHVAVKLELLGYDTSLWGGLTEFHGLVVDRYYQLCTGCPMFSVEFGGSIGVREVKVCDTKKDPVREGTFLPQRSLFASTSASPEETCVTNGDGHTSPAGAPSMLPGSHHSEMDRELLPWLLCSAPLLSDSDLENDWAGEFADFPPEENGAPPSPAGSYMEDPIAELGLYDAEEDLSGWSFKDLYDDSQWQEQNLKLKNTPHRFTGPVPGVRFSGDPVREPCMAYFLRFWPDAVLQRIVDETNRYAGQMSARFPRYTNGRHDWTDLTKEELLCWFGVLTLMGLKDLPNIRL